MTLAIVDLTKIISSFVNRADKRTAADLRAALAEIDQPALERKVDALEAERRKRLLRGTDAELEAIGREIASANLDCERAQAAIDELQRQIAEEEERERIAGIEAQADESRKAKSRLDELYDQLTNEATQMARLLGAVDEVTATIRIANRRFADIGRPDLKVTYTDPQIVRLRAREYLR